MERKSLVIVMLVMFIAMTGFGIVLPSMPYLADRLGLSSFQMGTLITGWAFAQVIVTPIWGKIIDKFGKKKVLMIGMLGFGAAYIITSIAQTYLQLLIIRLIGSILSSGSIPAALSLVADSSTNENRSVLMAKMGAINSLGFLCGPAIGGVLLPFGVNFPFVGAGICALLTLPFILLFINDSTRKNTKEKVNEPSFFQSIGMMMKPGYRELFIPSFGQSFAVSSLFAMLGYYLIDQFSAPAWQVSLGFSVFAGGSAIVQFFLLQSLYKHKTDNWIAKLGFILCMIGFAGIAFSYSSFLVVIACSIIGVGTACIKPTVLSLLSKQEGMGRGITMALDQTMDSFGRVLGPLVAGWIYLIHYTLPFIGATFICFLMLIIVINNGKSHVGAWSVSENKAY